MTSYDLVAIISLHAETRSYDVVETTKRLEQIKQVTNKTTLVEMT